MEKPSVKPSNPCFSSGPCAKRPGWSLDALGSTLLGRSHRSGAGKDKLASVIDLHRRLLKIPDDYLIGIVPGSDTGAIEMALWSMLGQKSVEVLAWENFSREWLTDVKEQLKLDPIEHLADYGAIPDLQAVNTDHDVVFVWNGTTSGACLPDAQWIGEDREGLTFCDATSAVFAYDLPWSKLDVTTWSWQKALGSEAAHGMMVLSPAAMQRLRNYLPPRPLPKIFRLVQKGQLITGIFEGMTINTPSMLAVEDCLDALRWIDSIGGVEATIQRTVNNYKIIEAWVKERREWIEFLASDPTCRSRTSIALKIVDPDFLSLPKQEQEIMILKICALLEKEQAAYDIKHYITAPPGFRLWAGPTIDEDNIRRLMPWIEWGYMNVKASHLSQRL